jgi:dipeptidyl aminopeptidase/acylaminoacyl peptidase
MTFQRLPVTFLLLSLSLSSLQAAPAGSFTIDQIMSVPFASELTPSPKGAAAAWIENENGRRNIWIASGPDWKAHPVTSFNQDDGQEIADIAWAPDGSYLLFARGGDFENGGENPNPDLAPERPDQSIWRVDIAGGAPTKLTVGRAPEISPKGDLVVFIRSHQIFSFHPSSAKSGKVDAVSLVDQKGEQSDLRWSPDGSAFAFVSNRGDHSFIGLYKLADKSIHYLAPAINEDQQPVWSPDGSHIAFLRVPVTNHRAFFSPQREGPPWSIWVADSQTGTGHEIFHAQPGPGSLFHEVVATRQIFWSADDHLVFPWERTGWCHLYSLPVSGGTPVELSPGEGEVEHVALSADRKNIYYSTNIGDIDRRHLWIVPADGNEKTKPITSGQNVEWSPAPAADGSAFVYLTSSYNERSHAAVVRSAKSQALALGPSVAPPGFPAQALVKPQQVLLTAADGLRIHGQLFLPPGDSGETRHPALVFFHGGSRRQMLLGFHYMYYYSNAYSLNQYFANQGYVVLSVNYRSGIGYGLNFREAINYGARGGSEFNDVIGAGLYLKSRSDVDPARIGVWGGSYGGYLTAMALSRASDLFAAGVDFHGVHDWSSLRGYLSHGLIIGDPKELPARQEAARIAFESSPMASVDTWRSPVLLIHGDDDRNVEFSQTVMLVEALRQRHVPFEELIFPNEIHDFLLSRHWVQAYTATADFFARKLEHPSSAGTVNSSAIAASRPN